MNSLAWIGVIIWGLIVAGFGLASAGGQPGSSPELQPHDLAFLVAGGLVSAMIGVAGLAGLMGWVPLLRKEQQNRA